MPVCDPIGAAALIAGTATALYAIWIFYRLVSWHVDSGRDK